MLLELVEDGYKSGEVRIQRVLDDLCKAYSGPSTCVVSPQVYNASWIGLAQYIEIFKVPA